jgi:hypothetical protein
MLECPKCKRNIDINEGCSCMELDNSISYGCPYCLYIWNVK